MTQTATLPALAELEQLEQWLLWSKYPVPGKDKPTKKPRNPRTGVQDDSNVNSSKWVNRQEALDAQVWFEADGVGIAVTKEDAYSYIDVDGCLPDGHTLTPYGRYIVDLVDSYFEKSPSGTGLRGIVRGKLDSNLGADIKGDGECKLEIKSYGGFMTITGDHWPGSRDTIEERQAELETIADEARERRRAARGTVKQPEQPKQATQPIHSSGDTPYGLSALADECQDLATTPEGGRNTRLNLAAFRLGQLVGGSELTRSTVEYDLLGAASRCGLDAHESEATFQSGYAAGLLSPRSAPVFDQMHHASETLDESAPDLDAMTLEDAKKLILSLRQENQHLREEKNWWNAIMANPKLKTVQKLIIRQRINVEQHTTPGRKHDGKWWWRVDTEQDGNAIGSDGTTISRNIPYLVAGGVLETWNEPFVLPNGYRTHLIWSRLTGAEKLPAQIVVPSNWGGKADRCECGGELKFKSRIIQRQRVGTCKKCGKVRVFRVEDVKSPLPVTPIHLDDEPTPEARADDVQVHHAPGIEEEQCEPEQPSGDDAQVQNARYWPEDADCTLGLLNSPAPDDLRCTFAGCSNLFAGYIAGRWLCRTHYDEIKRYEDACKKVGLSSAFPLTRAQVCNPLQGYSPGVPTKKKKDIGETDL